MTEKPSDKPLTETDLGGNINEIEDEAFSYYLAGGQRKNDLDYHGPERRTVNARDIDREMPFLLKMDVDSRGYSNAQKLIHHFYHKNYGPMSHGEGMMLMKGADKAIPEAIGAPEKQQKSAIATRFKLFTEYLADAAQDNHVLEQALVSQDDGPPIPNLELVRSSPEIHEKIAKQLVAWGFLWSKKEDEEVGWPKPSKKETGWPKPSSVAYKERYKYWLGFTVATSRLGSDDSMRLLYDFAQERAFRRYKNLLSQMAKVEDLEVTQQLKEEGKIAPINFAKLWQLKFDQSDYSPEETELSSTSYRSFTIPESIGHLATPEALAAISSDEAQSEKFTEEIKPKEEIMAEHEVRELEEGDLREQLEDRNWQPGWIDREVQKQHPSSSDQEIEDQKRNARARFIARLKKPPKKKSYYKRGWRESGASNKRVDSDPI